MALAGTTVYVATIDLPIIATSLTQVLGTKAGKQSGEVEALNLTTGKVEWDTKVKGIPDGAVTVSNNLVFTSLFQGTLIALNRSTGAIVFKQKLPDTTNSPIAIAGATVIVPAGGPKVDGKRGVSKIVAYAVP